MTGRTGLPAFLPVVLGSAIERSGSASFGVGVKDSLDDAPDIDDVHPLHCPGCGAVSRSVGESIVVVGHGVRLRRLIWKTGLGNQLRDAAIFVRRFLCRRCGVTITVLPTTVDPCRRYARDLIIFLSEQRM